MGIDSDLGGRDLALLSDRVRCRVYLSITILGVLCRLEVCSLFTPWVIS